MSIGSLGDVVFEASSEKVKTLRGLRHMRLLAKNRCVSF